MDKLKDPRESLCGEESKSAEEHETRNELADKKKARAHKYMLTVSKRNIQIDMAMGVKARDSMGTTQQGSDGSAERWKERYESLVRSFWASMLLLRAQVISMLQRSSSLGAIEASPRCLLPHAVKSLHEALK